MKGTIKSKEDVERLFQSGRRSSSSLMTVLTAWHGDVDMGRCAFIAGKKLGVAPLRSRCKRVLREAARNMGAPWDGFDVVFIAKRGVAHASHEKVRSQMESNLRKLGIM